MPPDYPIRLSVQLDESTADALAERAEELERSVAWVIRVAVKEYLEKTGDTEQ